ncbi:hypothetical protein H072_3979 [Dactylellina haptotyla CBS 200.50]|uniref:Uncharacterized protein n=1 Tax=Dactylellina haptotyla (strain CBS 200.50) TaxID=1284197 RepID=S8AM26_DACHA|nr:hypothetical protein H072_3979 [Dactylellina haptotyla CBS 200.50]
MSTDGQKFNEFVAEAGPSNAPEGADAPGASDLPAPDETKESPYKASEDQIASQIEKSEELPSYAELVRSGEVSDPEERRKQLSGLSVDIQLVKFTAQIAVQRFNEYKAQNIPLPLKSILDQSLAMHKILIVIRAMIAELQLSDDTYLYLQTASEYLGCQILVRYAILKKNPLLFRDSDGNFPLVRLMQDSYMRAWYKLAQMLTNPDFNKLTNEAKIAKIDISGGEFHLLLFKLIDPSYSYHTGKRISKFIDKVFGTPKKEECTSGLCNISPEEMNTIKYQCTCEVSKYLKRKLKGKRDSISRSHRIL